VLISVTYPSRIPSLLIWHKIPVNVKLLFRKHIRTLVVWKTIHLKLQLVQTIRMKEPSLISSLRFTYKIRTTLSTIIVSTTASPTNLPCLILSAVVIIDLRLNKDKWTTFFVSGTNRHWNLAWKSKQSRN